MRVIVLLITYLIIVAVLGFTIQGFAVQVWSSWVNYTPPKFQHQLAPTPDTPPLVKRVVVVLVDGARPDLVEKHATADGFARLIKEGCWFDNAWAYPPTYSVPARAAMATGLPHEITGVTSNWYSGGELNLSNVFSLAKEKGLRTAVVGDSIVYNLFKSSVDVYVEVEETVEQMRVAVEEAIRLLKSSNPPDLLWVGLMRVDEVGHKYGAASREYREALEEASHLFGKLLKALEEEGMLNETLVVLVSDHGHLDRGGHGGSEVEVARITLGLIGSHVARGTRVKHKVFETSVAPTIAMALGLPARVTAYGPPLLWAFTEDSLNVVAPYSLAVARNLYYHLSALSEAVGVRVEGLDEVGGVIAGAELLLSVGDVKGSIGEIVRAFDSMLQLYEDVKAVAYHSSFEWLVATAGILAVVVGVIAVFSRATWPKMFIAAIASGVAGVVAFWAFFTLVEGFLPTMSSVNVLEDYVNAVMRSSIVALLASGVLVIAIVRLGKPTSTAKLPYALITAHITLVAVESLPIYVTLASYGAYVKFPFPDWSLAYLYYTSLISDIYLLILAWILPVAAGLTWLLLKGLEGLRSSLERKI